MWARLSWEDPPVSTLVPSLTTMVLFSMGAKRLKYKESLYTHGPVALQGN
jgi:hypothetical protein